MNATADDGSCFSVGDACDDGDANTDGDVYVDCTTCQGSTTPVLGCTDVNACNFDAAATQDDSTCFNTGDPCDDGDANTNNDVYVDCTTCAGIAPVTCPASAKINEFHYDNAGSDVNEFVEIALPAGSDPTQVQVDLYNGSNGTTYDAIVLSSAEFVSSDGTLDYYVWNVIPQNGNDGIAVSCLDGTQYQFITYEGAFMATDGPFAGVMGVDIGVEEPSDALETNSIMCNGTGTFFTNCTADPGVANDLSTCVADVTGCTDANACNFDMNATADDGSCFSVGDACDDGDANTDGDVYVDCTTCQGSIIQVPGCTDATACNFDMNATVDDGTCFSVGDACDDGDANTNDDVYVDCATCQGSIIQVSGCTDATACNFDMNATVDDGTCFSVGDSCDDGDANTNDDVYVDCATCQGSIDPITGCTDACADNYDPAATEDDGSCNPYDDTCNQDCNLGSFGGTWDTTTCGCINETIAVSGCTDNTACNYNANANCDDGTCDFGNTACADTCNIPDLDDNCDVTIDTFDPANCTVSNTPNCAAGTTFNSTTCNCDNNPILGCIDMDACNFEMNANTDDGSCFYAEAATISTNSSTSICTDDGVDEPINVTIDVAGQGDNGAWLVTDTNGIILDLPAGSPFVLDGAGVGTCLIWYVNYSDPTFILQIGDNAGDLVAASSCAALSNSITVIRSECGNCAPNSGTFPWNGQ